jgi:uncharacterized membrane protein
MADVRQRKRRFTEIREAIARAFSEFLTLPTAIIAGFLLLSIGTYLLDRAGLQWLQPLRAALRTHVFADPAATRDLLGAIAAGLITVTSITISLLLVALQQSAATMTPAVFDQFLRRRLNQIYFGSFIGLAVYSLVTLATVSQTFNPVFGATCAFLLAVMALFLLILLLYTTINQMRPEQIMNAIHNHVAIARECHLSLLERTRRNPTVEGASSALARAGEEGFVVRIDIDLIARAAAKLVGGGEVTLLVEIGSYVAFDDAVACARAQSEDGAAALAKAAQAAVILELQRDIDTDPAYGVEQLALMGWTSVSTAKSNPATGLMAVRTLRAILARWSGEQSEGPGSAALPVVYTDYTFAELMDAFESLAIVSSESMQHQIFAEVLRTFAVMYPRLPPEQRPRSEDLMLRILPAMGDHALSRDLDSALSALFETLTVCDRAETASLVRTAQLKLREGIGRLGSRSTRAG